jgi:predicted TIM-barrel fold metal-dependent hydrolase
VVIFIQKRGSMSERLISADSHVKMTHEQVKNYLPSSLHQAYDEAAGGYERRMSRGTGQANRAGAVASKQGAQTGGGIAARNSVFTRPGYWDPVERLQDMDADGVEVEVLYSEVSAFRYVSEVKDGVSETVRAFNDALHDFASTDPDRLIVSYQIPIHDIELAVAEVERVAAFGAKSLQLPVFPNEFGQVDYYDERYVALFSIIQETGLPICCHIGLKTTLDDLAQRDPTPNKGIMVPMTPLMTAEAFGMFIMGGVFERFPDLKVVFVEPGLGWVAWWLETVDDMVKRQGYVYPAIQQLPSDYYRRNIHLTFVDEALGLQRVRDLLGVGNILWSTDFPHPVTSWPHSRKIVEEQFRGIPAEERKKIVSDNAVRVWNLREETVSPGA